MRKIIPVIGAGALLAAIALSIPAAASAGGTWSPCHTRLCWEWPKDPCQSRCCGGTSIQVHNDATVVNNVTAVSNTGGNEIKKSLKWNSIDAGDASTVVTIENNVNTNVITVH